MNATILSKFYSIEDLIDYFHDDISDIEKSKTFEALIKDFETWYSELNVKNQLSKDIIENIANSTGQQRINTLSKVFDFNFMKSNYIPPYHHTDMEDPIKEDTPYKLVKWKREILEQASLYKDLVQWLHHTKDYAVVFSNNELQSILPLLRNSSLNKIALCAIDKNEPFSIPVSVLNNVSIRGFFIDDKFQIFLELTSTKKNIYDMITAKVNFENLHLTTDSTTIIKVKTLKTLIDPNLSSIKIDLTPFHDKVSNLYGYKNALGETEIHPIYSEALEFIEGYAPCILPEKGLNEINPLGENSFTSENYSYVSNFMKIAYPWIYVKYQNEKFGMFNRLNHTILQKQYDDIEFQFSYNNILKARFNDKYSLLKFSEDQVLTYGEYDFIYEFHHGYAVVQVNKRNGDALYGLIDSNCSLVVDILWTNYLLMEKGYFFSRIKFWGTPAIYYTFDGEEYSSDGCFQCDRSLIFDNKLNKYGYIDEKGILVIPCIFTTAYSFEENIASVSFGKISTLIDKEGYEVSIIQDESKKHVPTRIDPLNKIWQSKKYLSSYSCK